MDQNNLARVFGPTVVGHGMSEPSPSTIMRDTNTQPKVLHQVLSHLKSSFISRKVPKPLPLSQVMSRLLSLPESYWRSVLTMQTDPPPSSTTTAVSYNQDGGHGAFMLLLRAFCCFHLYLSTCYGFIFLEQSLICQLLFVSLTVFCGSKKKSFDVALCDKLKSV